MFPWVEPRKNAKPEEQVMAMYEDYRFTHDLNRSPGQLFGGIF
jgi:hypothetical protein